MLKYVCQNLIYTKNVRAKDLIGIGYKNSCAHYFKDEETEAKETFQE